MEMDDDEEEPPAPGTEEDGSGRPLLTSTSVGIKVWICQIIFIHFAFFLMLRALLYSQELTLSISCF